VHRFATHHRRKVTRANARCGQAEACPL